MLDRAVMGPTEEAYDEKYHTEEQIIAVMKDAQTRVSVQDLCGTHGSTGAIFYKWQTKCADLEVSDVKKLRQLEEENLRLKQMVMEQALDILALKAINAKLIRPNAKRPPLRCWWPSVRHLVQKKATSVPRLALPHRPVLCYAMDFVHGQLATGRRFKGWTMTDLCSKKVPVIEVDASIGGERVHRILDPLLSVRSWPKTGILDNGPEFSGTALDAWAGRMEYGRISSSWRSRFRMPILRASTASFGMSV